MGARNPIIVLQPHAYSILWTGENYKEVMQFIDMNTPDMNARVHTLESYTGPGHSPLIVAWTEGRENKQIEIPEGHHLVVFMGGIRCLTEAQLQRL